MNQNIFTEPILLHLLQKLLTLMVLLLRSMPLGIANIVKLQMYYLVYDNKNML